MYSFAGCFVNMRKSLSYIRERTQNGDTLEQEAHENTGTKIKKVKRELGILLSEDFLILILQKKELE
jgi:hypothetical protein